jgi:hypothetical protein
MVLLLISLQKIKTLRHHIIDPISNLMHRTLLEGDIIKLKYIK